nr:uncharacterized protein LOC104099822 [Nicotiana tomentosiformis]
MINGEPTKPFDDARGLRQGDPMSPFLFAIFMKYLSRNLSELRDEKQFKYHPKCSKMNITHLSFADDLRMFAKGDLTSIGLLHKKFGNFIDVSGLQANMSKSAIYFGGVPDPLRHDIQQLLGYGQGELPFRYLEIPLATRKLKMLVKSVMFGVQSYWAQLFIIPAKVMKAIEAYCRSYIWSGANEITRKSLVSWSRICVPKSARGVNLTNLKIWNKAAIVKTCWKLHSKKDTLWIKWIHEYYIKGKQLANMPIPQQASWMVKKIFKARKELSNVEHKSPGSRSMIRTIYMKMRGDLPKITWKNLMCENAARPKAVFITWI